MAKESGAVLWIDATVQLLFCHHRQPFVDGANVGMSERRRCASFMKEILAGRGAQADLFIDNLYGNIAAQNIVISAIDNPHSSFPDLGNNLVMTQFLADQLALASGHARP